MEFRKNFSKKDKRRYMMKQDTHGGNIYKFLRNGKKEILDYSSNINPLGVPENFKKEVVANFDVLTRYPDPFYTELRENIGRYNGLSSENIVVGNGATEVLFLTMKSLAPKKALIVAPTFAEYKRGLDNIDSQISYYILKEENDFKLDVEDFLNHIKENSDIDLVVICNPNNPTGQFLELEKIKKINEFLKDRGIKLFVDEAFIEFIGGWEEMTAANLKDENIYIMRALTKFFAIPGLRLGYMISFDKSYMENLQKVREPWSINAFADLAGKTMLWDSEYIESTEKWIAEEKVWFYNEIKDIEEIETFKSNTNFILVKLERLNSKILQERMLEKNILVRDASNFVGLNDKYIRLAIKDRENNIKVIQSLKEVLE